MARYVVDPPTLLAIVRDEITLNDHHQLVAPNSLRSHALELLYRESAAGTLPSADARALHQRMTELKVRLLGDRVSRWTAWTIASEQGWPSLTDAEYLAVARLQADALATVDPAMAARAEGIVPVVPASALAETA